jgi:hypothetical protein
MHAKLYILHDALGQSVSIFNGRGLVLNVYPRGVPCKHNIYVNLAMSNLFYLQILAYELVHV